MQHILHIQYDQFRSDFKPQYVESVLDDDGMLVGHIDLKRIPRKARFDEVQECGCGGGGSNHVGWRTQSRRVYGHQLERKPSRDVAKNA